MYALDFQYDGIYLSEYGFIICDFNGSNGASAVSAGSDLTFTKIKKNNGYRYSLASAQYNGCIQTQFDICKDPDKHGNLEISKDEFRKIMRWLNRKQFCQFCVGRDDLKDNDTVYYNASFAVQKIYIGEILYGLRLNMETDSPFGWRAEVTKSFTVTNTEEDYMVTDLSDEIGDTDINLEITCNSAGDLTVTNTTNGISTEIDNCASGETITMDGTLQQIGSSVVSHKIQNDFNFQFMKISNGLKTTKNTLTFSLPCNVTIKYRPIVKDAPH